MTKKRLIIIFLIPLIAGVVFILLPDYSRRALINLYPDIDDHKIFSNNIVSAGNNQPWAESPFKNTFKLPGKTIDTIMKYDPRAFLVIRDDTIIYEKYYSGHTVSSVSNSFSVTKSIVSILIGCAIIEGYIRSVNDKVSDYLPSFKDKKYDDQLTIAHLLKMSSGLDYDEDYATLFSATTRSYYGRELERQVLALEFIKKPGTDFSYAGANTQLLGMIITEATGMSVSEFASQKLWKPVGAQKDALWSKDREDGMEKAFSCFSATARDLARVGKLIYDSGFWEGNRIIDSGYFHMMINPVSGITEKDKEVDFYGLHWWLTTWQKMDVVYARGIRGQYLIIIPSKRLVIVRTGRKRSKEYIGKHRSDLFFYLRTAIEISENTR